MGTAIFMMILFAVILPLFMTKVKNDAKDRQAQANRTTYNNPYNSSTQPRPIPRYDTRTGQPVFNSPSTTMSGTSSSDAHLCEPGSHNSETLRDYASSLNELEEGYRSYSTMGQGNTQTAYGRMAALSADERRKRQQELKDLRDAGIISQDEYNAKMRNY